MVKKIAQRWRLLKLFDRNLIIYLFILTFTILIFHTRIYQWYFYVCLHILMIILIFTAIQWLDNQKNPFLQWLRDWYIIIILPLLYWDLKPFLHMITLKEFDPIILKIDQALFGISPNIWVQQYVSPVLTEIMQISYSIYWITIPLGGTIFYFNKKKILYEYLLHLITITFFISYFIFIFFPVAGPRFFIANQIRVSYKGLFFTKFLRSFMKEAGFRGGAFPSSHVAVAVVILIFTFRFKPKIAVFVLLPLVIALSLATIYGQYHYFTDVLAGLTMGITIGWIGTRYTSKQLNKANLHNLI